MESDGVIVEYDSELYRTAALDQCYIDDRAGGAIHCINDGYGYVDDLESIISCVMGMANSYQYKDPKFKRGKLGYFGMLIRYAMRIDICGLMEYWKGNELSPYVHVFLKALNRLKETEVLWSAAHSDAPRHQELIEAVDTFVGYVKDETCNAGFKRYMRGYMKSNKKNCISLQGFIYSLFERYSKILVLRIDLGYSLGYLDGLGVVQEVGDVKKDFSEFLRVVKKGRLSQGICGYVWKLEFGPRKQFHYHCTFLLDGSKFMEDVSIADELGELWRNIVTKGRGSYFNCNRKADAFKRQALGVVEWDDERKIREVFLSLVYLVRLDLLVKANVGEGGRTFGKSTAPKNKITGRLGQ